MKDPELKKTLIVALWVIGVIILGGLCSVLLGLSYLLFCISWS